MFEKFIVMVLLAMIAVVILASTFERGREILLHLFVSPFMLIDIAALLDIFSSFLLVLIGLGLLETIKSYLYHNEIRVEVVLNVGIIAIARKIIVLDLKTTNADTVLSVSALIIALAVIYYMVKTAGKKTAEKNQPVGAP